MNSAASEFSRAAPAPPESATLYPWQKNQKTARPTLPKSIVNPNDFISHEVLAEVYKKIITKQGWVNYRKLKRDRRLQKKLKYYVEDLSKIDPDTLEDPRDRLATWLNLYNAMVLQEILQHYPIRQLNEIPNFFGQRRFTIGGREYSLLEIEREVFLETIQEPRAVLARVNGTSGGPRLRKEPFHPLKLEEQLEKLTWKFLMDRSNVDYQPKTSKLILSPLFIWYQKEFVDIMLFLRTYLDLLPEVFSVTYRGYDWRLNDEKLH